MLPNEATRSHKRQKWVCGVFAPVVESTRSFDILFVACLRRSFNTTGTYLWFLTFVAFVENAWHKFCQCCITSGSVSTLSYAMESSASGHAGSVKHCLFLPLFSFIDHRLCGSLEQCNGKPFLFAVLGFFSRLQSNQNHRRYDASTGQMGDAIFWTV